MLADARDKGRAVLADARDKAGPLLADARDKAAPVLADARDKAGPCCRRPRQGRAATRRRPRQGRALRLRRHATSSPSDVLPALTAALASVDEATEDARAETKKRGKAVAAALKGEVEAPEKKHRGRTLLVAARPRRHRLRRVKKFGAKQPTTSWQSSYTPPPAPAPPPAGGPVAGAGAHRADADADDIAASDPAEAASDAADVPHDATTPDNPVAEIDVDKKYDRRLRPRHLGDGGRVVPARLGAAAADGGGRSTGRCSATQASICSHHENSQSIRSSRPVGDLLAGHPPPAHDDLLVHRQLPPDVADASTRWSRPVCATSTTSASGRGVQRGEQAARAAARARSPSARPAGPSPPARAGAACRSAAAVAPG